MRVEPALAFWELYADTSDDERSCLPDATHDQGPAEGLLVQMGLVNMGGSSACEEDGKEDGGTERWAPCPEDVGVSEIWLQLVATPGIQTRSLPGHFILLGDGFFLLVAMMFIEGGRKERGNILTTRL